jgi:hypothetical protein
MPASQATVAVPAAKPCAGVQECAWIYDTGRKCRRIAGRGQQLCPGHRRSAHRPQLEQEAAFHQEMTAWVQQLQQMDLQAMLYALSGALAAIDSIIQSKASRRSRLAFYRATIALTVTLDRVAEFMAGFRAQASRVAAQPAPAPPATIASLPQGLPRQLSPEDLNTLCDSLLSVLKVR